MKKILCIALLLSVLTCTQLCADGGDSDDEDLSSYSDTSSISSDSDSYSIDEGKNHSIQLGELRERHERRGKKIKKLRKQNNALERENDYLRGRIRTLKKGAQMLKARLQKR